MFKIDQKTKGLWDQGYHSSMGRVFSSNWKHELPLSLYGHFIFWEAHTEVFNSEPWWLTNVMCSIYEQVNGGVEPQCGLQLCPPQPTSIVQYVYCCRIVWYHVRRHFLHGCTEAQAMLAFLTKCPRPLPGGWWKENSLFTSSLGGQQVLAHHLCKALCTDFFCCHRWLLDLLFALLMGLTNVSRAKAQERKMHSVTVSP